MVANNDTVILSRLVAPGDGGLSRGAAEALLTITFKPADIDRMNDLAALASEGKLTAQQSGEIESYNRIGHLLALLHSKARLALRESDALIRE